MSIVGSNPPDFKPEGEENNDFAPAEPALNTLQKEVRKRLRGENEPTGKSTSRVRQGMRSPGAKPKNAPGETGPNPLKTKEGVTSRLREGNGVPTPTPKPTPEPSAADPRLIIAFDAEWVEEPEPPEPEDPADPDAEPDDQAPNLEIPGNRVLSYQFACRFVLEPGEEPAKDCDWSGIIYTRLGMSILHPEMGEEELVKIPERIGFVQLSGRAISQGIAEGKLREWPDAVIAAGHFTKADLSHMADFAEFKDSLGAIHKTYVSFNPLEASYAKKNRHVRQFKVHLMDTMLLSPGANQSLDALGKLYGLQKFDTGMTEVDGEPTPYITRMDLYLADHPEEFEAYAIRDAEICALHVQSMLKLVRDDLGLDISKKIPLTIGSLSTKFLQRHWEDRGIDIGKVNGFEIRENLTYNQDRGRHRTVKVVRYHPNIEIHEPLAKLAFYGGRNESSWVGPTPESIFSEYDIAGAYITALSSVQILDYAAARVTHNPHDFTADQIGFARIRFRFPPGTRRPSLPIPADDNRGLHHPRSGTTYATSPEIAVALHLGAEIEILHGVVIPWVAEGEIVRPFESVLAELNNRRSQFPDGSFQNAQYKQNGNSLYGKLCQGVKGKKAYNPQTDENEEIGRSPITNVFIASYVTGLVRALLSELIAGIAQHYTIVSSTTDSIITDCPLEEIPLTGPAAQIMGQARKRLADLDSSGRTRADLLGVKSRTAQLLSWRTRGIATLKPIPGEKIKLAHSGLRAPDDVIGEAARDDWFVKAVLTLPPLAPIETKEPMPFPKAHRAAADFRKIRMMKRANFNYDHKRKIVNPQFVQIPVPGSPGETVEFISADTEPWETVDEFNEYRRRFEEWRFSGGGKSLRTRADWEDWQQFLAGSKASAAGVRRTKGGVVQQALRIVLRAYVCQEWGLKRSGPGSSYREVAEKLTAAGYPTNENALKNAARGDRPDLPENVIPAEATGVRDLVLALLDLWPSFEWENLVLDPPPGWLDNSTQEKRYRAQNQDLRQVEPPVSPWQERKVYFPGSTTWNGLITPTPEPPERRKEATPVPLRPVGSGHGLTRIA